jgi:prepilin-type processing-associated H-X9-DG protein
MDEHLVGYLLDALDPDERRQVEAHLRAHPESRGQLNRLRELLQPLSSDLHPVEPPGGLWVRTLARIAEFQCRHLPAAPAPPASRAVAPPRSSWRPADLLVAASILLCLALLLPSGIAKLRDVSQIAACQDNLRRFHVALNAYSDRHGGDFPNVATAVPEPRNVAGTFVPVLRDNGVLPQDVSVTCPAHDRQPPYPVSLKDVAEMQPEQFAQCAPNLAGLYAYTLGYWDENGPHGLRLEPDQPNAFLPILADQPPLNVEGGDLGNSPNHGGRGQNVLYIDGHCAYQTTRNAGYRGDDIYLNYDRQVKAGKELYDAVLGRSAAHP